MSGNPVCSKTWHKDMKPNDTPLRVSHAEFPLWGIRFELISVARCERQMGLSISPDNYGAPSQHQTLIGCLARQLGCALMQGALSGHVQRHLGIVSLPTVPSRGAGIGRTKSKRSGNHQLGWKALDLLSTCISPS